MTQRKNYELLGNPFQLLLMISFSYKTQMFKYSENFFASIISFAGMALFVYCLYVLYFRNRRTTNLITDGVFKYTRHPMYTGVILADSWNWYPANFSLSFWISTTILVGSAIIAGYIQERETLQRFGKQARDYYAKTPRIFLFYPLRPWLII